MEQETDFRVKRDLEAEGYSQNKDGRWEKREENGRYRYVEVEGRHSQKDGEQTSTTHY